MFAMAASYPPVNVRDEFERAREKARVKLLALAQAMGITEQQLSQQVHNIGHLSLQRLIALADDPDGRRFLAHFMPTVLRMMRLDPVADAMELAELKRVMCEYVNKAQLRMAKASLRYAGEERRQA